MVFPQFSVYFQNSENTILVVAEFTVDWVKVWSERYPEDEICTQRDQREEEKFV